MLSSSSSVKPSVLLKAFQEAASNVILVLNTKDVKLKSPMWIQRESKILKRFWALESLGVPVYRYSFDSPASAWNIAHLFVQGDMVNVRIGLDETKPGFRFTKDKLWIIERCAARKAIYEVGGSSNLTLSKSMQRTKDKIMDWIRGETAAGAHIMWLYRAARAGKSTIAQTLAESCHSQNLLLATFFFSQTDTTRNTIHPLIATIAHQIAEAIPQARESIKNALRRDHTIFRAPFVMQFNQVVL